MLEPLNSELHKKVTSIIQRVERVVAFAKFTVTLTVKLFRMEQFSVQNAQDNRSKKVREDVTIKLIVAVKSGSHDEFQSRRQTHLTEFKNDSGRIRLLLSP